MQINDLKDFNLEENNISDPYVFYSSKFLSLETLNLSNNKIDEKAVGSPLNHNAEKIVEGYFAIGVSKWMTITPDVQIYFDPAENQKSDTAAVFSLRATLMF